MESKLRSLAKSIGTKWPDLAIRLGVSDEDVKMTKADRKSIKDQAYRMLTDWYYNKGSQASIAEVEETVKAIQSQTAKSGTKMTEIYCKQHVIGVLSQRQYFRLVCEEKKNFMAELKNFTI
jgi:hypothetical protein